ncbi:hypothetical protein [Enterobacter roggenkampii]|uniref:hypothetical protein n=1 Tax=Enterobacter roggenkampii TaxID=1812935 RepID=UPI000DA6C3E5|nr:hypothetical protein [Enterobacter roggenkampii]
MNKDYFMTHPANEIYQVITAKLPVIDGYYTWHGRGLNLLFIVIQALVYLRDNKNMSIDYDIVLKFIDLKNLRILSSTNLPKCYQDKLNAYLYSLPNENELLAHEFITSNLFKITGQDWL